MRPSFRLSMLVAALTSSCGTDRVDFVVHETAVVVDTDAPFAQQPDLAPRVESTVEAALRYWGGDWATLRGRTITLSGRASVRCGGSEGALGCFDGDVRVTTADPGTGTVRCVEQTVLVHEIGHAVLGDPYHEDPRWMQLEPVEGALAGRVGYTASGEADCTIHLSV